MKSEAVFLFSTSTFFVNSLIPGLRVPGTDYTIKSYRVETNENAPLPHALKLWEKEENLLQNHGNWCTAMYGFGHDIKLAPHGPATDKIDRLCKHWRQQTRCLFESAMCGSTGSEFYTLKTFDNNGLF